MDTHYGSNEYPQSMFWSKNKKKKYAPVHPSFIIIGSGGVSAGSHLRDFALYNFRSCDNEAFCSRKVNTTYKGENRVKQFCKLLI